MSQDPESSMLQQAARLHDEMRKLKQEDAGKDHQTFLQRPYAESRPRNAVRKASVWFTAYMPSIIGPESEGEMMPPLETLCDLKLWQHFAELGIKAVHTGPVMKAGGHYVDGTTYPSIDGWFDPIEMRIDPALGSERDYSRLTWIAENIPDECGNSLKGCVIGDIVPGHTGMGTDFHLALQGFEHYPGLYVLARVDGLLDGSDRRAKRLTAEEVRSLSQDFGSSSENHEFTRLLDADEVASLVRAKVIPGRPQRRLGTQAGEGWSITKSLAATPDESGCKTRRWVYLHFFHPKQPTLNFLDPSYSAWRLVTGQLNYVMWQLRSTGVRLDANAFLGIEPRNIGPNGEIKAVADGKETWSESHPLSYTVTNMLAWQARRLGGFSFQEMNMTIPDIAKAFGVGPDLAYDFITRPACEHALLTGETSLLTFMYEEMQRFGIDPGALVHALQNHDEITYELVHLRHLEAEGSSNEITRFDKSADELRVQMREAALGRRGENAKSIGERVATNFYNQESGNGLCTTFAGLIAARLNCATLDDAYGRIRDIRRGHTLLAAFNALQPGVFALSGWDLVGALPVEQDQLPPELLNAGPTVKSALQKDYRWVNRGAFKLLSGFGTNVWNINKRYGCFGLPEAKALYGPLDQQRTQSDSFFSQIRKMLSIRENLGIATARFGGLIPNLPEGLLGLRMTLIDSREEGDRIAGAAVVLLNFQSPSSSPISRKLGDLLGGWEWVGLDLSNFELRDAQRDQEGGCVSLNDDLRGIPADDDQLMAPWEWKLFYMRPSKTSDR